MEEDDQRSSQYAHSHDQSTIRTPRAAKRPRTNASCENASVVLCLDDDPGLETSQVSPSKPPRATRVSYQPLIYVLSDSDEDEVVQIPTPQCSPFGNKDKRAGQKDAESRLGAPEVQLVSPEIRQDVTDAQTEARRLPLGWKVGLEQNSSAPIDDVKIPDDFEFPSPPPSSSDECDDDDFVAVAVAHPHTRNKTDGDKGPRSSLISPERSRSRPTKVIDTFDPSMCSQDSACFSFSREPMSQMETNTLPGPHHGLPSKSEQEKFKPGDEQQKREPYFTKAFDYVLTEVLTRYRDVLRPYEVELATSMRQELSRDAIALFVRIYRRKQPQWYRVAHLHASYGTDIDVDTAMTELCTRGLVISSVHAAKEGKKVTQLVARELVKSLRAPELKAVLSSVSDSSSLKKLSARKLLPALQKILVEKACGENGKKKFKQTTLTGLSQADCLSKAVLKRAGHSIRVPEHVLEQLQRIHFLFFLEDGHDSPNVILADTGKTKFPDYECRREKRIFPSPYAFEDYETAIALERRLNRAMEHKDYLKATHYGSIAELEVREYFAHATDGDRVDAKNDSLEDVSCCSPVYSSTGNARMMARRSVRRKVLDRKETSMQLKHPFLRRYTAHWVYVRTAWHSINAVERLGEYEVAVQRLKLLLGTGLIPRRRGKCLNRLTINLYKHMSKLEEALEIILSALQDGAPPLHFGDRIALVNRGIAIHRKLALPAAEVKAMRTIHKKLDCKKAAAADVIESRPAQLVQASLRSQTKVKIRKIYGKSLQVADRERKRKLEEIRSDPWETFKADDSRDSVASTRTEDSGILGKSKYSSLGTNRTVVSVENYCLEWYLGKEGWCGVHDEGSSLRFLFSLLFWECALFAPVEDVFQTPYQDRPLDMFTEAFYHSRKEQIDNQVGNVSSMSPKGLRDEVLRLYTKYKNTRAIGCDWNTYSAEDLSHIAAGLGGPVTSLCCKLLAQDYAYWCGGLPDLTLWKADGHPGDQTFETRLVEVKSPRDTLSERQRAWLIELKSMSADCEVCKVVEKVTARNASELGSATLDSLEINAIDAASAIDDTVS